VTIETAVGSASHSITDTTASVRTADQQSAKPATSATIDKVYKY